MVLRKPGTSIGVRWEFPGGKMEEGETPQEALAREYREELSLDIAVGEFLLEGRFSNNGKEYLLKAYRIELLSPEEDIRLSEHSEYRWADPEELAILDFPPSDEMIRDFLLKEGTFKNFGFKGGQGV